MLRPRFATLAATAALLSTLSGCHWFGIDNRPGVEYVTLNEKRVPKEPMYERRVAGTNLVKRWPKSHGIDYGYAPWERKPQRPDDEGQPPSESIAATRARENRANRSNRGEDAHADEARTGDARGNHASSNDVSRDGVSRDGAIRDGVSRDGVLRDGARADVASDERIRRDVRGASYADPPGDVDAGHAEDSDAASEAIANRAEYHRSAETFQPRARVGSVANRPLAPRSAGAIDRTDAQTDEPLRANAAVVQQPRSRGFVTSPTPQFTPKRRPNAAPPRTEPKRPAADIDIDSLGADDAQPPDAGNSTPAGASAANPPDGVRGQHNSHESDDESVLQQLEEVKRQYAPIRTPPP
jgi:hypothetical protein